MAIRGALLCMLTLAMLGRAEAAQSGEHPQLARARTFMARGEHEQARQALQAALDGGGNGPSALAEIFLLSGEVEALLGDPLSAEASFLKLLAIAPKTRLPLEASPKAKGPFDAARSYFRDRAPLHVKYSLRPSPSPAAILDVESDPLGMVAAARAEYSREGERAQTVERLGKGHIEISLPATPPLKVVLAVLDANGNRLLEIGSATAPLRLGAAPVAKASAEEPKVDSDPPVPGGTASRPPFYARWYLWGSVAVVTGVSATVFGLRASSAQDDLERLNAQSDQHDFREAQALKNRMESSALTSNILFGVAGAATVVTVILLVRDARSSAASAPGIRVAPLPLHRGAGVTLDARF